MDNLYASLEKRYMLPEGALSAVESTESGGNDSAISPKGAKGRFQFMPATASEVAKALGIPEGLKNKPEMQIKMAAYKLSKDLNKYKNNPNENISKNARIFAYAEYNAGAGNIKKALSIAAQGGDFISCLPDETKGYVASQLNSQSYGDAQSIEAPQIHISSSKKFFNNFNQVEEPLKNLLKLPQSSKQLMSDFLTGKG